MFNFIKNFGCAIAPNGQQSTKDIQSLKLEDLNVRKCINLDFKLSILQILYASCKPNQDCSLIGVVDLVQQCSQSPLRLDVIDSIM
jgi:hypothetical protein